MNKNFRIIWNRTKGCYVVASEKAKSVTKSGQLKGIVRSSLAALAVVAFLAMPFSSYATDGISINGANANANGAYALAIGNEAKAKEINGIAIGNDSTAFGQNTIAVGGNAIAYGSGSIAIGGFNNQSSKHFTNYDPAKETIATLNTEQVDELKKVLRNIRDLDPELNSTTLGTNNERKSNNTVAGRDTLAIGNVINARENFQSVVIGSSYKVSGTKNLVLGIGPGWGSAPGKGAENAVIQGEQNIALGVENYILGDISTPDDQPKRVNKSGVEQSNEQNGVTWKVKGGPKKNTVLGSNNTIFAYSENNTIIGSNDSLAIPEGETGVNNVLLLGSNIKNANASNSVYLGSESQAFLRHSKNAGTLKFKNKSGGIQEKEVTTETGGQEQYSGMIINNKWVHFAGPGAPENGVITVGAPGKERRIQNVAAGLISPLSTDAINGSQLYYYTRGRSNRWRITEENGHNPLVGLIRAADQNYYDAGTVLGPDGLPIADDVKVRYIFDQGEHKLYRADDNGHKTGNPIEVVTSVINPYVPSQPDKDTQTPIRIANIKSDILDTNGNPEVIGDGLTDNGKTNPFLINLRSKNNDGDVQHLNYGATIRDLQNLSNSPLGFKGDGTADPIQRKLGETLTIKGESSGAVSTGNIRVTPTDNDTLLVQLNKSVTGLEEVNTKKVSGLDAPSEGTDAANKEYVDNTINTTVADSNWIIQGNGNKATNAAETESKVNPTDTVNFVNGTGTTATVTDMNADQSFEVKYDVVTTTLDNATGSVRADNEGIAFATGKNIADMINSAITNSNFTTYGSSNKNVNVTPKENKMGILGDAAPEAKAAAGNIISTGNATDGTITFALANTLQNLESITANKSTIGNVVTDSADNTIKGLSNTTWEPNNVTDNKAATEGQLKDVADAANTALTTSGWNVKVNNANSGVSDDKVNPDDTVDFANGVGTTAKVEAGEGDNSFKVMYDINKATLSDTNGVISADKAGDFFTTGDNVADMINKAITKSNFTFYGNNDSEAVAPKDNKIGIIGDAEADVKVAEGNIKSIGSTADGTIKIQLADELKGLKKVTVGEGDETVELAPNAVTVGGNTYVTKLGINANDKKITNVADGDIIENSKDAVNAGQLYNLQKGLTDTIAKGTVYAGDRKADGVTENNFTRALGEATNIVGGNADGALSDNNIGVESNGTDTLTVKLAKEVKDLTSVETKDADGNTAVLNGKGVTATGKEGQSTEVTADGVAVKDKDGNATTTINKDGITTNNITVGDIKVDGDEGTIGGLKNKDWNPDAIVSGQAATEDQLKKVADNAQAYADKTATTVTSKDNSIKVIESKNTNGGNNYDISVDAQGLLDAAQTPTIYTNKDGQKVYKVGDKFYTTNTADPSAEVHPADVIVSLQDANGTTNPTTLAGVGSSVKDQAGDTYLDKLDAAEKDRGGKGANDAVNVSDLNNTAKALEAKGQKYAGDFGSNGTNEFTTPLGGVTNITGGVTDAANLTDGNIGIVSNGTDGLTVKLAKNLKGLGDVEAKSVTADTVKAKDNVIVGDAKGARTEITPKGITVLDGENGTALTANGLNNGGNVIANVAPGVANTDAVNVGQLRGVEDSLRKDSREGDSLGAALAALKPIQYDPLEPTQIMAGLGFYKGHTSAALGVSHYGNESTMYHAGFAYAGQSNMMANVGVTWKFGHSDKERYVRDLYRKGPISSVYVLQDQVTTLEAENKQLKNRLENQNNRIEKQEKMLQEALDAIKALKQSVGK